MKYSTVYSLFADRVKTYAADKDVFFFRSNDRWQGISWQRFEQETFDFATALLSHDLKRGGSVCILMGLHVTLLDPQMERQLVLGL